MTTEEFILKKFRSLNYYINIETVRPSEQSNGYYIDRLNKIAKPNSVLLDLCAGSGCIGLSVFKQSKKIKKLILGEINPRQVHAINQTIKINKLPKQKISVYETDVLNNIPLQQFDLISCNPPHVNTKSKTRSDIQGMDFLWGFHKKFFAQIPNFMNTKSVLTLIENLETSKPTIFKKLLPPSLKLYKIERVPLNPFYIMYIKKI